MGMEGGVAGGAEQTVKVECLMGNGKTVHASGSPAAYSTKEGERLEATKKQMGVGASC